MHNMHTYITATLYRANKSSGADGSGQVVAEQMVAEQVVAEQCMVAAQYSIDGIAAQW